MKAIRLVLTLGLLTAALILEFKRLTLKPWPPRHFNTAEMHFKYGSIGAEVDGYPYLIWRELPTVFSDRIPSGYAQFGFITEPGHDLPIGISVRRYGVERVGFNCATCHVSQVQYGGSTRILLGAPASQLNLQAYIRFLIQASSDPRLTPRAVFDSAERNGRPIGFIDRLILEHVVFPKLGREIAQFKSSVTWMETRPEHGPGRTDAGNFWREKWGLRPENDQMVGTVDFPSVWAQRRRLNGGFHWDGNNSSLEERNISAALAGGAAEWLMDRNSIGRVSNWLLDLRSPVFPAPVDNELARKGRDIYDHEGCGSCHDDGPSGRSGSVTPIQEIGTDPQRLNLFSMEMVQRFNEVGGGSNRAGLGYSWRFRHYQKTNGYVNMPLDGIWARAPYLHNGSVPSLQALLLPQKERPKKFFRGCADLDVSDVGFQCQSGFEFDTSLEGNDNSGHNFGTSLSQGDKAALLEYLKTL